MTELDDAQAMISEFKLAIQQRGERLPSRELATGLETLLTGLTDAIRRLEGAESLEPVEVGAERDMLGAQLNSVLALCMQAEEQGSRSVPIENIYHLVIRDPADETVDERVCRRCGGPNRPWSAPSPLWNQVMRGGSINGDELWRGVVCPTCFMVLAQDAGVADLWRVSAERVHVQLQNVTPSGRVWNPRAWMWVD